MATLHQHAMELWLGLSLAMTVGAGTAAAESAGRYFCYVSVGGENRIAVYHVDPDSGALEPAGGIELDGAPGSLAISPDRKVLYAAVRTKGSVAALAIDPNDGGLKLIGSTPVVENPVYIVTDRTGRFLLTSYYGAGKAAVYPISTNGAVGGEATQVLTAEKNPHSILMDPSNRFVYVPNTGSDTILQYRFDERSGRLSPLDPPKVTTEEGSGPRHVIFHPSRDFVYFVNEKGSSVTAFRLDGESGQLAAIQTLPTLPDDFTGRNSCADIEITPDGKYLYASNRGHDSLAGYAVDGETGRLTPLGRTPTEKTPREFALDPAGRFVYAAGQDSGRLASYRLDSATGKLNPLEVYDVGKGPAWVLVVRPPEK